MNCSFVQREVSGKYLYAWQQIIQEQDPEDVFGYWDLKTRIEKSKSPVHLRIKIPFALGKTWIFYDHFSHINFRFELVLSDLSDIIESNNQTNSQLNLSFENIKIPNPKLIKEVFIVNNEDRHFLSTMAHEKFFWETPTKTKIIQELADQAFVSRDQNKMLEMRDFIILIEPDLDLNDPVPEITEISLVKQLDLIWSFPGSFLNRTLPKEKIGKKLPPNLYYYPVAINPLDFDQPSGELGLTSWLDDAVIQIKFKTLFKGKIHFMGHSLNLIRYYGGNCGLAYCP